MSKILVDEAAVKLALEWIEDAAAVLSRTSTAIQGGLGAEAEGLGGCSVKVAAALREALEKEALHKLAAESLTVGLRLGDWAKIHCVNHDCDKCKAQQEPVAMRMPKVGDKVVCIEDDSLGTVAYLTAGGSPEIKFDDGSHGTYLLREFAELFRYAQPPAQPLTDDKYEAIVEDLADWSRYVEVDTAHQSLEAHVREVLTAHGITKGGAA